MVDRIKLVLSVKNLTSAQLAQILGVQRSGISHILSGRNKPSLDFILKVIEHFPEINEIWLLKGEGEMMKSEIQTKQDLFAKEPLSNNEIISQRKEEDVSGNHIRDEDVLPYQKLSPKRKGTEEVVGDTVLNPEITDSKQEKGISQNSLSTKRKKISKLITFYEDMSFDVYYPA